MQAATPLLGSRGERQTGFLSKIFIKLNSPKLFGKDNTLNLEELNKKLGSRCIRPGQGMGLCNGWSGLSPPYTSQQMIKVEIWKYAKYVYFQLISFLSTFCPYNKMIYHSLYSRAWQLWLFESPRLHMNGMESEWRTCQNARKGAGKENSPVKVK